MADKIRIDENEFDCDNLSHSAKTAFAQIKFTDLRIKELSNLQAILQRAKNSYVNSLKKEIVSSKAGIIFDNN